MSSFTFLLFAAAALAGVALVAVGMAHTRQAVPDPAEYLRALGRCAAVLRPDRGA